MVVTRSGTKEAPLQEVLPPVRKARAVSSGMGSRHSVHIEERSSTAETVRDSDILPKLGTFLAAGGVITALYSFGKDAAYNAAVHGMKWLGWSAVNTVTGLTNDSKDDNFLKNYIATYTQLRQEAQAGYFEGYCTITLSIAALLGTAFIAHTLYKRFVQ